MSSSESESFQSAEDDYELSQKIKPGAESDVNDSFAKSKNTDNGCETHDCFRNKSHCSDGWELGDWSGNKCGNIDNCCEYNVKTFTGDASKEIKPGFRGVAGISSLQEKKSVCINPDLPQHVGGLEQSENISCCDTCTVLNDLSSNEKLFNSLPNSKSCFSGSTRNPWSGVMSFLSTASEGVSSLTSHVSHGFSTVIESSIRVPEPEEMARIQLKNELKPERCEGQESNGNIGRENSKDDLLRNSFVVVVSGVTQIGSRVITGGLDTLEGIGKKTMTILQDNDPLLRNKRKFLGLDSLTTQPVLSQMLREAKEKSEETEKNHKEMQKHMYRKQLHFETLFDQFHGLVHLEALERLSKQTSIKLQSLLEPLTGKALEELHETLNEVKGLCDLGDFENDQTDGLYDIIELEEKFRLANEDLDIEVDLSDLTRCWKENTDWLNENENASAHEFYEKALNCLAETTALAIHKMHKLAEMLLIKNHHSTANEADSLIQLTSIFCWHLIGISNRFASKLNCFENFEENSSLITTLFLEESNSTSYVQSAFQLFIPILQIGAV